MLAGTRSWLYVCTKSYILHASAVCLFNSLKIFNILYLISTIWYAYSRKKYMALNNCIELLKKITNVILYCNTSLNYKCYSTIVYSSILQKIYQKYFQWIFYYAWSCWTSRLEVWQLRELLDCYVRPINLGIISSRIKLGPGCIVHGGITHVSNILKKHCMLWLWYIVSITDSSMSWYNADYRKRFPEMWLFKLETLVSELTECLHNDKDDAVECS